MVWMVPFGSTDSTMPTWREPQTISSPGAACALVRPVRCAQSHTAPTEPKPWPCSPSGTPAWRAAHEAKYAHHGPMPAPAVAERYWAMRGESLEPGGCSAWPTSASAAWTIAWPGAPAAVAVVGMRVAVDAAGLTPLALSIDANWLVVVACVGGS